MWQIKKADRADRSSDEAVLADIADKVSPKGPDYLDLKVELHRRLIDLINLSALEQMSRQQIEAEVGELIHEQLALQKHALNHDERKQLVSDILDELLGLGPLEPLLQDGSITDILVNGHEVVFVERKGLLEKVETRFKDERHLLRIIQKIVSGVGRRIDESSPFVDAPCPMVRASTQLSRRLPSMAPSYRSANLRRYPLAWQNLRNLAAFRHRSQSSCKVWSHHAAMC